MTAFRHFTAEMDKDWPKTSMFFKKLFENLAEAIDCPGKFHGSVPGEKLLCIFL